MAWPRRGWSRGRRGSGFRPSGPEPEWCGRNSQQRAKSGLPWFHLGSSKWNHERITTPHQKAESPAYAGLSSSGGGIRTRDLRVMARDLRVMSPTSYLTAPPRGGRIRLVKPFGSVNAVAELTVYEKRTCTTCKNLADAARGARHRLRPGRLPRRAARPRTRSGSSFARRAGRRGSCSAPASPSTRSSAWPSARSDDDEAIALMAEHPGADAAPGGRAGRPRGARPSGRARARTARLTCPSRSSTSGRTPRACSWPSARGRRCRRARAAHDDHEPRPGRRRDRPARRRGDGPGDGGDRRLPRGHRQARRGAGRGAWPPAPCATPRTAPPSATT